MLPQGPCQSSADVEPYAARTSRRQHAHRCSFSNASLSEYEQHVIASRLLIVEDDADVRAACREALRPLGAHIIEVATPGEAISRLAATGTDSLPAIDAIVLDLNFRRGDTTSQEGLRALRQFRQQQPRAACIVITAFGDVPLAVTAMREGAIDFITKPWRNDDLLARVRAALRVGVTRRVRDHGESVQVRPRNVDVDSVSLIGESHAMQRLRHTLERVAPTDANVLLLGENGTGKGLAARMLHQLSPRANGPLVTVDMGAISAHLFESELFGHRRGAFTDAKGDRVGRLSAAHKGTLLLDEIGNLPLALQPKLLNALETRHIQPVGADVGHAIDVRIVSATNLKRSAMCDESRFRPDLLFRLNTVEIELPPLRDRADDIPKLASYFVDHFSHHYRLPPRPVTSRAMTALQGYHWPGNVRALRHAVERAVIMAEGTALDVADFALPPLPDDHDGAATHHEGHELNLDRIERETIRHALTKHAWNITLAARELGLSRAALYRRMERHGL